MDLHPVGCSTCNIRCVHLVRSRVGRRLGTDSACPVRDFAVPVGYATSRYVVGCRSCFHVECTSYLGLPFTELVLSVINNTVEAVVSVNRIRSFLLCDEYQPVDSHGLEGIGVRLDNVSAAYDSKKPKLKDKDGSPTSKRLNDLDWELALLRSQLQDAEKQIRQITGRQPSTAVEGSTPSLLCLKRVDFECKAGEVVAVVGGVGCGKSSFVNAILGEVRELSGTTSVNGKLAYFSQNPFIMNATLKDNVLFGHVDEPLDEKLYQQSLDCCALRHDLELLDDGDLTEIGEKGVTLSGGT